MPKRTSNSSVNSSIRQQTKSQDEGFSQLLVAQQQAVEQLGSIRQLMELSKEKERQERTAVSGESSSKAQSEIVETLKQQLRGSRRYWKLQEDFQKEWDKEAKDIAEMAKGMKTFKTMGEKWADKKEGLKEKFGVANGGLKKTVLGALNVGGIFNKTLEKDKFIAQQKALGAAPMAGESGKDFKKRLSADFEGAQKAAKETKKTEAAIAKHKEVAGIDDEEHLKRVSPEFAKLVEKRQSNSDEYAKYQRATDTKSPTPVTRLDSAKGMNMFGGKTPAPEASSTETAAEHAQDAEVASESKKVSEESNHLLKIIADNTGGANKAKDAKPKEEKKPEGGGLLDSIFSMLTSGLMNAFKALLNPGAILKALGRVFAIGMIVGALFEGIMDGFDEFMKTGDIGKALIAGLAGIIDFLTFGLFDKEKIKEVIGDFSKWIGDHLIKPFTDFIGGIKDSFLSLIENIGLPKMGFTIPVINKEVSIGPFYPFKKDAKSQAAPEPAAQPQSGNVVDQKSANNEGAKQEKPVENKTAVVNAPVTTNNSTTQIIKSPIRNQESSSNRYLNSRYA
jgi:hypothetical protein